MKIHCGFVESKYRYQDEMNLFSTVHIVLTLLVKIAIFKAYDHQRILLAICRLQ